MTEQRFRFVVSSAEEAVTVLRERIGEHARVISVRQVEGTGLARFLQAPKLEVIAENVPPPASPPVVDDAHVSVATKGTDDLPLVPAIVPAEPESKGGPLARLLHAGGVSPQIIGRIRSDLGWPAWETMPPGPALTRIGMTLRAQFRARPGRALGNRVAFLGSPGAGTTSALCKWLSTEVFVRQKRGVVLKLDLDRPNPGDALAIFCEAFISKGSRSNAPGLMTIPPPFATIRKLRWVCPTTRTSAFASAKICRRSSGVSWSG